MKKRDATAVTAMAARVVSLVNLPRQHEALKDRLDAAVSSVFQRGEFIDGTEVAAFEAWFARHCGVRHAIGVASGTDALEAACRAVGITAGDEVLTVPNTFIATPAAIAATGARPAFVDVSEDTACMDPSALVRRLTPRVKAIMPVHLYGQPAPMAEIMAIAAHHHLLVIEDAAQAHGAVCGGARVGSIGEAGCFSFYPTKNLGAAGDGGMVTTNNDEIAHVARMWRNHGRSSCDEHTLLGRTARLDSLQAAVLLVKAGYLDGWNARRREVAAWYFEDLPSNVRPLTTAIDESVYHLFVVRVEGREALREHLTRRGIETAVHYPRPLHLQPAFRDLGYGQGDFPVAERLATQVLTLPMHPFLDRSDVACVCCAITEFYG